MKMTDPNDDMLDDLLATARNQRPAVSGDLMSRVLADAAAAQAMPGEQPLPGRRSLWAQLLDTIGGWPALGGLAAATIAGFWVGAMPPSAVTDITAGLFGDTLTVSLTATEEIWEIGDLSDG